MHEALSGGGGAGECNAVNIRVQAQCLPSFCAQACNHIEDTGGMPASVTKEAGRRADNEDCSAGLSTTLFPTASAGATFHAAIISGKFQ